MGRGRKPKSSADDIKMKKIGVFFRKSILQNIMNIMTMKSEMYRSFKSVKNINRLFSNIDLSKYKGSPELEAYIWCITYFSKEWLNGITTPELIAEMAKRHPDYDSLKDNIITMSLDNPNVISPIEAKKIFDIISDTVQDGYLISAKDEMLSLLDDIDLSDSNANIKVRDRLFQIAQSLMDIKHSTNVIDNKLTFNSNDVDSVKTSLTQTINSLKGSNSVLKTGIKRLNTLLSPGYLNGRLYIYLGGVGSGKSLMLLKSALDIRRYNKGFVSKTPGMKPCVLYITMENSFTETIERLWNMMFDNPVTHYGVEEATEMFCKELGIRSLDDILVPKVEEKPETLLDQLAENDKEPEANIDIVIKYFPYRGISTDDLYTIIQDLRDENMEVIAIILDYIKRIEPSIVSHDSVKLELSRIVNELKTLAVIKDIPVITAHQLNRSAVAAIDNAARSGQGDLLKNTGREHVGDAFEVLEVGDFIAAVNIEYKPGTTDKYICFNVLKRRRLEQGEDPELTKCTYIAHPFARNNGLRIIDDINKDEILSLKSLSTDIEMPNTDKRNAVNRLKVKEHEEFMEDDRI